MRTSCGIRLAAVLDHAEQPVLNKLNDRSEKNTNYPALTQNPNAMEPKALKPQT